MRAMTMKERLKIHREIERESERKLNEWKEETSDVQYAEQSAG